MNRKLFGRENNVFVGILTVAGVLVFTGPAAGQSFNQFVGFGDSSIDSGSYRSLTSPRGGANFDALWLGAVAAGAGKSDLKSGTDELRGARGCV